MTIPNLVAKYQQKSYVVAWRKAYSDMANSLRLMQAEEEYLPEISEFAYAEALGRHMKVSKICHEGKAIQEGCFPAAYKVFNLSGANHASSLTTLGGGSTCMVLLNGNIICFDSYIAIVDVNGFSKPNTIGKDIYAALIDFDKYTLHPAIGYKTMYGPVDNVLQVADKGDGTCNPSNTDYGWGCSYWYLHNMP